MKNQVVPRVIARMMIPFVVVFGFYVVFHGEIGPGGGFQGGVILASAVIMHSLIHGIEETRRAIPRQWVDGTMVLGVLIYIGVGIFGFIGGHAFLDYTALGAEPHGAEALGMTLVEFGVALTVAAVPVQGVDARLPLPLYQPDNALA